MPGVVRRFLRRLASSDADLAAELLAEDSRSIGARPLAEARVRERVHARGVLRSITVTPGGHRLEAELNDGSGSVVLIWMGRQLIPGVEAGRTLDVRGTLTVSGGRRVIFNPAYEIRP